MSEKTWKVHMDSGSADVFEVAEGRRKPRRVAFCLLPKDAALVAAAPELLAALARCVDLLAPYGDEEANEEGSIGEALQVARFVMAKARRKA